MATPSPHGLKTPKSPLRPLVYSAGVLMRSEGKSLSDGNIVPVDCVLWVSISSFEFTVSPNGFFVISLAAPSFDVICYWNRRCLFARLISVEMA